MTKAKRGLSAFSILEAVIAIFLLSFAALSVLSLTQTGFVAQKRNQDIVRANLALQSVIADLRIWGEDLNNFKGSWTLYNSTFNPTGYPEYTVRARCLPAGRPIDSPCAELETQWAPTTYGKRTMPNAIVPVELTIMWTTDAKDSLTVLTYVGEPKRDVGSVNFIVTGPSNPSISMGQVTDYSVRAEDSSRRPMDNLMYQWVPDDRYVSLTDQCTRDGRKFQAKRDKIVQLPDLPPPLPPAQSPVTCYTKYAGQYLDANPEGIQLP